MSERPDERLLPNVAFLHLVAMFSLAVVHPLYTVLGHADHAPFFIAHESRPVDIVLLVLAASVMVPLALCALLWTVRLVSPVLARVLFAALMAVLLTAFFLPIFGRLPEALGGATIPLSMAAAAGALLLYLRAARVRTFVGWMSILAVVSPVMFLTGPTVRSLLAAPHSGSDTIFSGSKRPNVVMIILDELPLYSLLDRNREVDRVRYPNFHRLAERATWFRNTTSVHYSTSGATASLLVGGQFDEYLKSTHPDGVPQTGAMDRQKVPSNLFSMIERDYLVFAVELVSKLAPESEESSEYRPPLAERLAELAVDSSIVYGHIVTPAAMRGRLPVIEGQWRSFAAAATVPAASSEWPYVDSYKRLSALRQFIESLRKRNEPSFYFLHSLLPHFPFAFNEHGQIHDSKFSFLTMHFRKATGNNDWPDETSLNLAYQAHLLQLGFTDVLLGRILDKLESEDMFDDSLILVTSDHGTSYYWDRDGLGPERLAEVQASGTMFVPLIVKLPGQRRGEVSDRPVQTIDIVPTLADVLDLEIGWEVEGVSAFGDSPERTETYAYLPGQMRFGLAVDPGQLALERKIELFRAGSWDGVYRLGPHPEMLGEPVASFPQPVEGGSVRLDRPEQYRSIDPDGPRVPAYVEGEIELASARSGEVSVAVAVNGVIRATTRSTAYAISELRPENRTPSAKTDADRAARSSPFHFLVRVPPESFEQGKNEVAVYVVEEDAEGRPVSLVSLDQG